ncbi:hypothetical protein Dda_6828 [Drechslerella dactyloides]|uniref:Uncharacterized protein n=1 Tax=Drechslerella dactyloides TaxID=74499 RepID=A0AAD6NHS0_DREDA|nr:hypothetical protein Dda_6828 [Drechslerella dactyloides]
MEEAEKGEIEMLGVSGPGASRRFQDARCLTRRQNSNSATEYKESGEHSVTMADDVSQSSGPGAMPSRCSSPEAGS